MGHTQYAGAFLLLPQVLPWWEIAQQCSSDDYGSLQRGFLTSVFMPVVGLERVFHLGPLDDPGFAVLSGGTQRCPSRYLVGAWRRHLAWSEVDRFCHRTSPWELLHDRDTVISRVLRFGRPSELHAIFDAGAGKSDANVRALLQLAETTENLEVTLRACRYPHRMKLWKQLSSGLFTRYEEPGVCEGAPPNSVLAGLAPLFLLEDLAVL